MAEWAKRSCGPGWPSSDSCTDTSRQASTLSQLPHPSSVGAKLARDGR
ncbi:hypothetical protein C4K04_3340 [Pseudomonas chlororaphis]|uniref:Uncharacterized protein n=1 Tax=Pseudomonas chlororaphis TaxID=587753 RepID=A0A3G7TRH1_9PSED|nr:hypothetical protein C4K04_3340 [Pseudomonas chlororaphis]